MASAALAGGSRSPFAGLWDRPLLMWPLLGTVPFGFAHDPLCTVWIYTPPLPGARMPTARGVASGDRGPNAPAGPRCPAPTLLTSRFSKRRVDCGLLSSLVPLRSEKGAPLSNLLHVSWKAVPVPCWAVHRLQGRDSGHSSWYPECVTPRPQ